MTGESVSTRVAERDAKYILPTYKRQPLQIVGGKGTEVFGYDGRCYLDFVNGLSVSNFGHCHPAVVEAVQEQVASLIHCSNLYYTAPQAEAARLLSQAAGGGRVFFGNSGAEANEAAIKIARKCGRAAGKTAVVTLEGSFHGRTMATLSATGQPDKMTHFAPALEVFRHVSIDDEVGLKTAFGKGDVAALLVEPVAGESGVRPVSESFLKLGQDLCRETGALLMMDEVQAGLGRCGAAFAYQRFNLDPDVITVAKSLAGGLPMGAVIARNEAQEVLEAGDHGSTFGGGPVVAAAAVAILGLLAEEGLFERVEESGARLEAWLNRLAEAGVAADVRRLGLMAAVDLKDDDAREVVDAARSAGILLNSTSETTLRFLPALTVSGEEIDRVGSFLMEYLAGGREVS